MAELNKELKEYLARSDKNESKTLFKSPSVGFTNWFSKPNWDSTEESNINNNSTNGWFSEAEKDPLLPSLTKRQRITGFMGCVLMGFFCFSLAALYTPVLFIKARKFAFLYTLGSIFIISSFSLLWGPYYHIKHLCSRERLPFTGVYFGTMFATLYSALWVKSTFMTSFCALFQVLALIWYIISYIPGGQTGLRFFTKIFTSVVTKTASKTLPV